MGSVTAGGASAIIGNSHLRQNTARHRKVKYGLLRCAVKAHLVRHASSAVARPNRILLPAGVDIGVKAVV